MDFEKAYGSIAVLEVEIRTFANEGYAVKYDFGRSPGARITCGITISQDPSAKITLSSLRKHFPSQACLSG